MFQNYKNLFESGPYEDGTDPWDWDNSRDMFEAYLKDSVCKYVQCWGFGAVLTSVYRCLGIPARAVTIYNTAHDGDTTSTIDVILLALALSILYF